MRIAFILSCCVLPVAQFLVFWVYANFSAITMAFKDSQGAFTLANFARFFDEFSLSTSDISIAFRNTFLTFGIVVVAYPFKVLVSFFIYKKVPFYNFYRVVFFFPSIIFSVAMALIFTRLVSVDGIIAEAVGNWVGLDYAPDLLADSRFANKVVLLEMIWLGFPGDLIIWGGTFARIPVDVLESGKIDGTTWWTEFTKIVVPLVWPTVALQMLLIGCSLFSCTGNVFLLTAGQYNTITLHTWMYQTLLKHSGGNYTSGVYNYMSAVGLMLTTVAIIISLVIRRYTNKAFGEVEY